MISAAREFKVRKQEVLSLYDEYMEMAQNGQIEPIPDVLQGRVKQLRDDRFIIAVCGEVKAGKSTFINALIGEEALPTHRLQKSSVLIDVRAAPHRSLIVEFGDGHEEVVYDESDSPIEADDAYEQLSRLASLQDEYRDLPVTVIEDFVLERESGEAESLLGDVVVYLKSQLTGDDRLPDESLIEQYLVERGMPEQIPVRITLSLPLAHAELSELRIVDTPGVNALGGVQDRTYAFIESAHATLFVHDITETASEPFKRFLERGLSKRSKRSTLLVLTHAGGLSEAEIRGYLDQMGRDFPEFKGRMIHVDSELQLIGQLLEQGHSLSEVENAAWDREDTSRRTVLAAVTSWARRSDRFVEEVIREQSNFDALEAAVRKFASNAPLAALNDLLSSLDASLKTASSSLDSQIRVLKKKRRSPQEFEQELARVSGELHRYRRELGDFTEELEGRYVGHGSTWRGQFSEVRNAFNADLSRLGSVEDVRALFTDANAAIDESLDGLLQGVRERCEAKLKKMGGDFTAATEHQPPQIDFVSLERAAKKKAEVEQPVYETYEGFSLNIFRWVRPFKVQKQRKVGSKIVVDEGKKLHTLKGTLLESFNQGIDEITSDGGTVETAVKSYVRSVAAEGKRLADQRQRELDAIKQQRETNEELSDRIEQLEGLQTNLSALLDRLRTTTANL